MDSSVHLDNVVMQFGDFTAVQKTDLKIESGEFFSFLGPSGCGKTTILNMISGFLDPTQGVVRIGGNDMRGVPANKRPTSMIFQNLALFPLMTVAENIEFGLEVRGVSKAERKKTSDRLLELVALEGSGTKKVSELSGGQKQRIAIARALAVEPQVLLLDEPLSALDLKLRQHMRTELKEIQRKTGITFIYITHDQGEALTMSDRVAVMSAGKLQQVADPITLYRDPKTAFVASFVGENNGITGTVLSSDGTTATIDAGELGPLSGRCQSVLENGSRATLFVRPEQLHLNGEGNNHLAAKIDEVNFEGSYLTLNSILSTQKAISVQMGANQYSEDFSHGHELQLSFSSQDAVVIAGEADHV
ncbi:ABC transporter ATP-binding protein [Marinomonas mediterranea]|jgi:ABC-type spermidine/putrescine transport systems, ATPase components|uniref:Polyamine-transporting ATPase n=1 Tax=Marinomonas mediterranea (strain ATCC 700492 / JCM 21426 / NBRC 103028 / MMB-1) TaxID=717774 RepID=F2JZC5_MARM1|nr:ABC transporter ATP-binding protein [Marinomonas mediterranea]ADZ93210.1 Polyamine-transporting ATPase [Marinomonas mediterranea MMB-1]WCN11100.1 ATP-binding cassette domain-containing protein [Marinomonas mediterranea]WCN15163.1 ATP-binding cassette domain-containing protein [Marinomonas mediterranea]WCN19207.1 ATP-binding cassette domain-containing protein [Marinomonas mediterranea MMB-1]